MKSLLDVFGVVACGGSSSSNNSSPPIQSSFTVTALVSDGVVPAAHTDANLKNPWGVAFNPKGFVWVAGQRHQCRDALRDPCTRRRPCRRRTSRTRCSARRWAPTR
jgi:hypothetical protein